MGRCRKCKGKGWVFVSLGNIKGEEVIDKDICLKCNGKGYIEDYDSGEDDNSAEEYENFRDSEPDPEDR